MHKLISIFQAQKKKKKKKRVASLVSNDNINFKKQII